MMKQLARLQFSSFQIKVPQNWKQPQGDPAAKHYSDAFTSSEKATSPVAAAPPLVIPHTMNKYHTDTQKMIHGKIGSFLDGISDAICSAWQAWMLGASYVGVIIASATASAGQVVCPVMMGPLIIAQGPKSTPMEMKYTAAVANVINTQFPLYSVGIKLTGMPLYPAFVSPLPTGPAPPMINTPMPLKSVSKAQKLLSKSVMKPMMIAALGDPMAPMHKELFDAVCDGVEKTLEMWEATTMLSNIMCAGAVAGFPVGPVVGTGIAPPGAAFV